MKVLVILAIYAATGLQAAMADVLFYGGDLDGINAMPSERDWYADARAYDDFLISQQSSVTGVFGTFYDWHDELPTSAYFELRSGMEPGSGGTLIASGDISVEATFLGFVHDTGVWRFSGKISSVELAPGNYWVALALISNLNGRSFLSTTSGDNGVGEPLGNGNTFFDGVLHFARLTDYNFIDTQELFGEGTWDFSIGIEGHAVPEPSTIIFLSLLGLLCKQSRKVR